MTRSYQPLTHSCLLVDGESGYGVTRGDEGLLEMTVPRVISVRKGSWLPHAKPPTPDDEALLDGLLQWNHADTWMEK